jgi:DNA repair exonuclease SbcCD ATPase subunit
MSVEENNIRHARNRISTIEVDQCPTCGQAIDESYAENIREHENQSIETGRERLRTGKKKYDDLSAELETTQQTLREINGELATMQELKRRQETQQTLRQHLESEIKNLESEIDGLKKELKAKDRTLDELSLEITANKWLREIADGEYSLRVSPYTEKKTGGVKEAIAIHVDGIAGGHGYQGASGGQRRRIDVALLLALAELAQASSQYKGGTIFFDEVFDSLDASGVASVSKVIGQLGQRMPVVIISHSASLVDGLQADLHYHIDHGAVT